MRLDSSKTHGPLAIVDLSPFLIDTFLCPSFQAVIIVARKPRKRQGVTKSKASNDFELPSASLSGKVRTRNSTSDLARGDSIKNELRDYEANAIDKVRTRTDINEIIATLMTENGLVSSAANSMVAMAANSGYRLAAYDSTGAFSSEVMSAAFSVLDSIDSLHSYDDFNDKPSIQTLLATLQLDVIATGGCGIELVLDEQYGADRLIPIPYSSIEWVSDGKGGRFPSQEDGDVLLNIPTVFIAEHNRKAEDSYSTSLLRPGIKQTFLYQSFLEDTHRAVTRTGHSRLISTISQEAVRSMAPAEISNDKAKMAAFYNSVKEGVQDSLQDLEPEDSLVSYDTVEHKVEDTGGSKADYSSLMTTLGNLLGVSLKTPASVSGLRAEGGQGLSNAETLIYLKVVEATRPPVAEAMSRALTLAVRLLGVDGHVKWVFDPIELRPSMELEAYKGTRQKRILEQLSFGVINDAEACYELGIRPQGLIKEFSGTGFYTTKQSDTSTEKVSSVGRALSPGTPESSGGDDND